MMNSIFDFYGILKNIVVHYPLIEDQLRLNTFAVINSTTDLDDGNIGQLTKNFQDGTFWSRTWVYNGADPNKLEKEYSALVVEVKEARTKLLSGTTIYKGILTIATPIKCKDCPTPHIDTLAELDEQLFCAISFVIDELLKNGKYQFSHTEEGIFEGWASEGQVNYLNTLPEYESIMPLGTDFCSILIQNELNPFISEWGVDNLRTIALPLEFEICDKPVPAFNYNVPAIQGLGVVKCDC